MPQKVLRFTGINRRVNEFQGTGACEELINLRPDISGGHKVVKTKDIVLSNVQYDWIYEHSYGNVYNTIAVTNGVVQWIDMSNGDLKQTITSAFSSKSVTISSAGNVIVIYCEETKKQYVAKFEENKYVEHAFAIRNIRNIKTTCEYKYDESEFISAPNYYVDVDGDSESSYTATLLKAFSGFYGKYPKGLCGASIIGFTYELNDGTEVWSTGFTIINSARVEGYRKPSVEYWNDSKTNRIRVFGATNVYVDLYLDGELNDEIKRINIYASRPVFPYKIGNRVTQNESTVGGINVTNSKYEAIETSLEDENLAGQLMYYQGSIAANEDGGRVNLNFGTSQSGESVLKVDAGCIERVGDSISYNNRFHYFRSSVEYTIQKPTVSRSYGGKYWIAYVKFNGEWKLINHRYQFNIDVKSDFAYPLAQVKELAFVRLDKGLFSDTFECKYEDVFFVKLNESSAYNYSYAFDVSPQLVTGDELNDFVEQVRNSGQVYGNEYDKKVFLKEETNAINVSAQYNPFVFPVEYSYSFGGEISDITTSYLPISSTQIGQYPITVFTSNGIFALEQGGTSTLYSNIVPLQPTIAQGKATSTPSGTFFVSSNNIYMMVGRAMVNISEALDGEIDNDLKANMAFNRLCCSTDDKLYDFSNLLSRMEFRNIIADATLVYDQLHNELYISSNDESIQYSYVFNLDTKEFHKTSKKYLATQNGTRYAIEIIGGVKSIVDMHNESHNDMQYILLQSRPLPIDLASTHIQRLLFFVDSKLSGSQNICISVFGSDNLHDWKCIISAQKRNTILRQIRTNKAAKSFRDYIVLINGTVDTNTDISDIIADFTVVNRRLG